MLAGMWYFEPGSKSISDLRTGGLTPLYCSLKKYWEMYKQTTTSFISGYEEDLFAWWKSTDCELVELFLYNFTIESVNHLNLHQWQLYCSFLISFVKTSHLQWSIVSANGKNGNLSMAWANK